MENLYLEFDNLEFDNLEFDKEKLAEQLYQHRHKLGLKQIDVAELLEKSEKTYQRWESKGKGLTNIQDILKLLRILEFSTTEIIELFGFPPLTPDELEVVVPDEDTLKSIKEEGLYSYIRNNCTDMKDFQIERLLDILFVERLKRHQRK